MESTISILTRFFENWTVTREVVSITDIDGTTATIKVCDPLWVTPCLDIQLDGLKYNVKSVNKVNECEYDFVIMYSGALPTATEYETCPIYFKHGQPERLNYEEIQNEALTNFLRIYLFELFPEDLEVNTESTINNADRIKLYALIQYDVSVSDIETLTATSYEPMRRLLTMVAERLDRREGFNRVRRARLWNHPDFGIVKKTDPNDQNYKTEQSIINIPLTGVELEMTIEVLKTCNTCKT